MLTERLIRTLKIFCLKNFANESTFRQANEEYNKGNYAKAITLYDSIISNNLESSEPVSYTHLRAHET